MMWMVWKWMKIEDSYKKGDVTNSEDDESVDFAP